MDPIRIVGICGSLRPGSFTRRALKIALEGAAEFGAETDLLDLRTYDLPFCVGKGVAYPPEVDRFRADVRAAQGILLGTPEYHGGYSGVLKNALDLMGFEEFGGKMVGLIGVSGGVMGATNALNGLRTVGRSLHAWVIPLQATVPQAWKLFTDDGRLQDPLLEERLKKVGRQVARFTVLHTSEQVREFLSLWESSQPNPGAE